MSQKNVALIGSGFAGKAHAVALAAMPMLFWPVPVHLHRKVVVDTTEALASEAKARFGFEEYSTDWEAVVRRPDIDVIHICSPNDTHHPIAIAAARAGKHILCEKPMASTPKESLEMCQAAEKAGVVNMIGLNFRHTPAVVLARELIDEGAIGDVTTYRGHFEQDWSADPGTPLSWRFQKARGGGALGDIGAHILDMTRFLLGDIESVSAIVRTLVPERPIHTGAFDKFGAADRSGTGPKGKVDVDDELQAMLRFKSGVVGTLEVSRNAYGRSNWLGFEIHGTRGSIVFDYHRLNQLQVALAEDASRLRGFRTVFTGPEHPSGEFLWPLQGMGTGFTDIKMIEMYRLSQALAGIREAAPTFRDGHAVVCISEAILKSGEENRWVKVSEIG